MSQAYIVSGSNLLGDDDTYRLVYQSPTSTTAMVNSVYMANTGSSETAASLKVTDSSE